MNRSMRSQSGFSMIELVIASSLLGLLVMAVSTLAVSGGQAQDFTRRLSRATEVTQDIVDQMRLEMVSSVRVFGDDTEGNANLAILDLDGAPKALDTSRLPVVSPNNTLARDTAGTKITGNSLFFTRLAWSDRFVCTSGQEYLIDVYRWIHYYLTPVDGGPKVGSPLGLNLVRVVSEPLVDAAGVDGIDDPLDREEVMLHLVQGTADATGEAHAPAQLVWLRGGLPGDLGTIRQINSTNGKLSDDPIEGREDPWLIHRANAVVDELLSYRHHSVASIYALPAYGVGRYGVIDESDTGFPHGFEVQVVGPSSARQVMLHLVVASTQRQGQVAWADVQVSVDARDL